MQSILSPTLVLGYAFVAILSGCATPGGTASSNAAADKVVYHINDSANASNLLRNINNHLEVNPATKIVVVSHAKGVDFLMNDAKDTNGNPYHIPVEELKAKGVKFDVCQITLRSRKLEAKQFIPEATFVPSGVAEVGKLQAREGYSYLKP